MFKDDYKKANESLNIDNELFAQLQAKVEEAPPPAPTQKVKPFPLKRVIAIAASVTIVLSALIVSPYLIPEKNVILKGSRPENNNASSTVVLENTTEEMAVQDENEYDISSSQAQSSTPNSVFSAQSDTSSKEEKKVDWKKIVDKKYHSIYSVFYKHLGDSDDSELSDDSDMLSVGDRYANIQFAQPSGVSDVINESTSGTIDYSGTNNQIVEVDEADIVKTDGKYIYRITDKGSYSSNKNLVIYKANGKKTKEISDIKIKYPSEWGDANFPLAMFVKEDKLFIIVNIRGMEPHNSTGLLTYDISNPKKPKLVDYSSQLGSYSSSRLYKNAIYIISSATDYFELDPTDKEDFLPYYCDGNKTNFFQVKDIYLEERTDPQYTVVCSYSTKTSKLIDNVAVLGGGEEVYMNTDYLLCSGYSYYDWGNDYRNKTALNLFKISKGKIKHLAHTTFSGWLLNQFSMDIYKNHLRLVATVRDENHIKTNSLLIFDMDLKITGKIEGLAEHERIYSARFQGDIAYFVTYRETDPLFCADLSNPKKPKILSALKIPGFSTYLHPFGDGLLLGFGAYDDTSNSNNDNLKLSMFDTSNLKDVKEKTTELICDTTAFRYSGSEALENHKAFFVSPEKNIIGFQYSAMDITNGMPYSQDNQYALYKYTENGFELIAEIPLTPEPESKTRAMYIGNYFYISTASSLIVLDMNSWDVVKTIE